MFETKEPLIPFLFLLVTKGLRLESIDEKDGDLRILLNTKLKRRNITLSICR
jgi:hypothetical protein